MKPLLIIFALLIFLTASAQKQGIRGQVFWIAGNQMPGPDARPSAKLGVQREVYIYELTLLSNCTMEEGFFTHVSTKLITKVVSDEDGSFKVKLPIGQYSVFIKEPKGLFANLFDKDNTVNPVVVKEKRYSWITIAIDYQAAY
jgi:hypothetical protein